MRWVVALSVVLVGCAEPVAEPDPIDEPVVVEQAPDERERAAYQALRAGAVQIDAVLSSIAEARSLLTQEEARLNPDAFAELLDYVDSTGATLADFPSPPEDFDTYQAEFAAVDEGRLVIIDDASVAVEELRAAEGIARSLAESDAGEASQTYERLAGLLRVAAEDLTGAIETLGGQLPTD